MALTGRLPTLRHHRRRRAGGWPLLRRREATHRDRVTVLRNPPILVLDEATSALDTQTERAVQGALERSPRGGRRSPSPTGFPTVRDADQIVVLDGGRVVEVGTHQQLLARGGRYVTVFQGRDAPAAALTESWEGPAESLPRPG